MNRVQSNINTNNIVSTSNPLRKLYFNVMLRHTGQRRNMRHDVRLAIMLCFSAGFINAAGFLAFQVLTTNVTGHAALLAVHTAKGELSQATIAAIWLALFLLGAFLSGIIIRLASPAQSSVYTLPLLVIVSIIGAVALGGGHLYQQVHARTYLTGALLLAMGMQNALVTIISGALVRTTHLTGMFTDLGIDLATAIKAAGNIALRKRIWLRLAIICFFLAGGIAGGWLYLHWHFAAFGVPATIMLFATGYDRIRVLAKQIIRKATVPH